MPRYPLELPAARPRGLTLTAVSHPWFRVDAAAPEAWTWETYPHPRSRFDSATGQQRVRYAGQDGRVALRERFDASRRVIGAAQLDLHLVQLHGRLTVLDLRRDRILDALGLDDQVNTSRAPEVWHVCQQLIDRVAAWFGPRCHGVVYRSRTTPQRSANLAFFEHAPLSALDLGPLRVQSRLLDSCVLADGFEILGWS